jgi:UDP-N-acetylglucosamine 2-epimerase (non-hydrolysing)
VPKTIDLIVGARPNLIKVGPVTRSLARSPIAPRIVHTGQHYDRHLSDVFFHDLGIPNPHISLNVGSATPGRQTARILDRYEERLLHSRPEMVVVFGDVNSTLGCALAAVKLGIPVCHVEAGLRSFDRTMPEEINRVLTDSIAGLLLASEESGIDNLRREGVPASRIRLVGNVMVDTLMENLPQARARQAWKTLALEHRHFGLITLHRPSNVDDPVRLTRLVSLFEDVSERLPMVFSVHPRTARALTAFGIRLSASSRLRITEPLAYVDNLSLMDACRVVLTDSGGMQEETTALRIPCLTLRENTERPVTIEKGTNCLVGSDPDRISEALDRVLAGLWPSGEDIPLWDGHAADRITDEIIGWSERDYVGAA